jgi:uronate dehydrogenase
MRQRILITGPCGRVGRVMVPLLRQHYALRLVDRAPASSLALVDEDEFVQADLRDRTALQRACEGVEALIHLAAVSDEDDFHSRLLPANLEGLYNAFEAARQAGLKKVVFPSTGQTVLGYPRGQWVTTDMPPRPSTVYACTKLFGEALARYYSDQHGMSMMVIRLCFFQPYESELLRQPGEIQREWCSPRDLEQLLLKCLRTDLSFGIFFGVSANTGRFWDTGNGQQLLGYEPRDNAAEYLRGEQ